MSGFRVLALLALLLTLAASSAACSHFEDGAAAYFITLLIGTVGAGVLYRLGDKR